MLSALQITDIAKYGLVKDLSPHRLPPGAWSDANNVRFVDGYITQAMPAAFYNTKILDPTAPCYLLQIFGPGEGWVMVSKNIILFLSQGASTGFSPGHSYAPSVLWNGGMFNGFVFLNNFLDAPRYAYSSPPTAVLGDLPYWPSDLRVKVMRAYKNFLIGLDISVGGLRDKRRVRWSCSADPGTLPVSWDITDATKDAGDVSLAEGTDGLLDCLPLGNGNIVYGETQTWAMRYVGGQSIFAFDRLFPTTGLLATDALTVYPKGHFVVTQDDLIVHAGDSPQSVGDLTMRRWFFKHLSPRFYAYTQVFAYKEEREVWIVFPSVNAPINADGFPQVDSALIWNWQNNLFTFRDLSFGGTVETYRVMSGYSPVGATYYDNIWDLDSDSWDSDTTAWEDIGVVSRDIEGILLDQGSNWMLIDSSIEGTMQANLERSGLALDTDGRVDEYHFRKMVAVRPDLEAPDGTQLTVVSGHQDLASDPITWDETQIFTVGTDVEVQINATGRFLALRFYLQSSTKNWKFYGYHIDQAHLKEGL